MQITYFWRCSENSGIKKTILCNYGSVIGILEVKLLEVEILWNINLNVNSRTLNARTMLQQQEETFFRNVMRILEVKDEY